MIAGESNKRNASAPEPTPSLCSNNITQSTLAQKAIGFNCLNYKGSAEGALTRHTLPAKSYIDSHCPNGLRLELMFPSCWDGVNLDSHDHKSHVAYPDLVMEGKCPRGFESRIPALYYETIWDTLAFKHVSGKFLLSNGDYTGKHTRVYY